MSNPLVTIYMPTYNRSKILSRAIKSVLNQTHAELELIIVDDNSQDDTQDVIIDLQRRDSRITYIRNNKNLGACQSRNKAIFQAKGDFVTGIDDDDYFKKNRIESFITHWEKKNIETQVLFSKYIFKKPNNIYYYPKFLNKKKLRAVKHTDIFANFYLGSQVFTTTDNLRKIDGFDPLLPAWQDFECWYRLLALGTAELVDEYNYVVDISHECNRISDADFDKLNFAYQYFIKKHGITRQRDLDIIYSRLHNYDNSLIKLNPAIHRLVKSPSRSSLQHLMYALRSKRN